DTQGPVVPRGPGPAVDLPRGEDETSPLREVDDGVQSGRRSGHVNHSSLWCVRTWRVRTGQTRAWLARAPHQPTWPTTDRETRPAPPAADAKLTTVLNSLENDSHDLAPRRAPLARRRAHPLRVRGLLLRLLGRRGGRRRTGRRQHADGPRQLLPAGVPRRGDRRRAGERRVPRPSRGRPAHGRALAPDR